MPAERYFIPHLFKVNEHQELKGSEFHHLAHVMRTRKGEQVELVNGQGALAQAIVQEIKKEKALLNIIDVFQESKQPQRLILAQAMPKPNRLDFILEKGTELGIDIFWIFPGHLSVKKDFFPHQIERAQALMIAAMKQCGRLTLPSLAIQSSLEEWPILQNTVFFGDLNQNAPLFETAWKQMDSPLFPIIFVTGPESGWSEQEIQILNTQQAIGVKLHTNVLRTDTASLMALSLLSHWLTVIPK